jgi:hypothetical protein
MTQIQGEIEIGRPIEEVFDFVADERHEPDFNPRMLSAEKLTPGPIGAGTRFTARMRGPRPVGLTVELTEYDRPRRLGSRTHLSAMDIEGALTFEPGGNGTRMRWAWELEPHGVLRLLRPLLGFVGARQERAIWAGLKRRLEAPVP